MEEGHIKEVLRWFPGTRFNYAEKLLWSTDDGIALTGDRTRSVVFLSSVARNAQIRCIPQPPWPPI